jgi:hypothetical protein
MTTPALAARRYAHIRRIDDAVGPQLLQSCECGWGTSAWSVEELDQKWSAHLARQGVADVPSPLDQSIEDPWEPPKLALVEDDVEHADPACGCIVGDAGCPFAAVWHVHVDAGSAERCPVHPDAPAATGAW